VSDPITSQRNPRIMYARGLARASVRRAEGRTLVEGPHALEAASGAGAEIVEVFALEDDPIPEALGLGDVTVRVNRHVLEAVATTGTPRSPIAIVTMQAPSSLEGRDTLVLYEVGDPGNAGTLLRTASAFGMQVATTPNTVDMWSPKVLRSAAGTHWTTAIVPLREPIEELRAAGLLLVASVVAGGLGPDEAFDGGRPVALLVGSEPHGLSASVAEACDRALTLGMSGDVESLNVAIAGSIAIYELGQRR